MTTADHAPPRAILFFPATGWDTEGVSVSLPLSVLTVAAPLDQRGWTVTIIDQRLDSEWQSTLRRALADPNVKVLGLSTMTGWQIRGALDAAQVARDARPDLPLVWGGVHPSLVPATTVVHPLVDAIVVGEGEPPFTALCEAIQNGESWDSVPGIQFTRNGQTVTTPKADPWPMDDLPPTPYHLVDAERYVTTQTLGERDIIINTSRGCPHPCTYCYVIGFFNRRWRAWSPERVLQEVCRARDLLGVTAIHLDEDEFFVNVKRVEAFCDLLEERKLQFTFKTTCRVDYLNRYEPEFLARLRHCGFKQLFIGVESGSDRVLKHIKKQITVEDVLRCNRKLAAAGIVPKYSFMAGMPTETMEDVRATLRLMRQLVRENPDAHTTPLQVYAPYPGTPMYDEALSLGMPEPQSLEEWASLNWNRMTHSTLSRREQRFLEDASYFTFFLDGKTVAQYYEGNATMQWLARLYSKIIGARCDREWFHLMPEIRILKRLATAA